MRYLFGFLCVCALGVVPLVGCGGEGGTGSITPGLWLGGSPASNTDGNSFDTGWAICFHVNEDGTALTPSADCDIDGGPVDDDDDAGNIEVSWKDDVGWGQAAGEPGECSWTGGFDQTVAIEDNSFEVTTHGSVLIIGSFDGGTATGTASGYSGIMPGADCDLVGGWTASPAP
jgi:hypothetical protein